MRLNIPTELDDGCAWRARFGAAVSVAVVGHLLENCAMTCEPSMSMEALKRERAYAYRSNNRQMTTQTKVMVQLPEADVGRGGSPQLMTRKHSLYTSDSAFNWTSNLLGSSVRKQTGRALTMTALIRSIGDVNFSDV